MRTLEQMTPEQKLGRVLCCRRLNDQDDIDFTLELVKNNACGAIQMIYDAEKRTKLVKAFREAADYPLIIVNDMEQGYPASKLPKLQLGTLAAANNPEYVRLFAAAIAKEAKEDGFNGCWGPVEDIATKATVRLAGATPEAVLDVTREINRVFAGYRFHATAKHYPGGWCKRPIDSHMAAPHAHQTKEELLETSLVPYKQLMQEGLLPSIMVGHWIYDNIDPGIPASLSKKVLDIIRQQGFDGVIYSDSFAMISILQTFGEKQAYAMSLMAGVDILLPNYKTPTREVYEMMLQSYREGLITNERLDEAVRRVMALEQYCAQKAPDPLPVPDNMEQILDMAARDCITADCDVGIPTAIDPAVKRLFVVEVPIDYREGQVAEEVQIVASYNPDLTIQAIKEYFPGSEIGLLPEFPNGQEVDRVLRAATRYNEVVFVSFCGLAPYTGGGGMTRRIEAVINALSLPGKLKALVHFGSPQAVETLWPISRIIYGYNAPASQKYAFEVLAGKYPAKGKNPYAGLYTKMSVFE